MTGELVVITDSNLPDDSVMERILEGAGHQVRRSNCNTAEQVVDVARNASALIVQWAPIDSAVLRALPSCRFISRLGIGVDMINLDAATAHGVGVSNTPSYCVEEVSAHTVALILQFARQLRAYDAALRAGTWSVTSPSGQAFRPTSTTVSIIGYGRIGRRTAGHLRSLGFRILVHDPIVDPESIAAEGHVAADLDDVLAAAHIVSLHAPLNNSTKHLIGPRALALMRPGSYLVNTCRGGLVDETALVASLLEGHLGGAALDVFESEPLDPASALLAVPEVTLTPHAAWYSPDSMADLPREAAENVVDFLAGRTVASIVNPLYSTYRVGR